MVRANAEVLKDIAFFASMWQLSAPKAMLKEKWLVWKKRLLLSSSSGDVQCTDVGQDTPQYAEVIRLLHGQPKAIVIGSDLLGLSTTLTCECHRVRSTTTSNYLDFV